MQILLKDPQNRVAMALSVVEVQSARYNPASSQLLFYGSYCGKPAAIFFSTNENKAKNMIYLLFQEGRLDCTNFFSQIQQMAATILIELKAY